MEDRGQRGDRGSPAPCGRSGLLEVKSTWKQLSEGHHLVFGATRAGEYHRHVVGKLGKDLAARATRCDAFSVRDHGDRDRSRARDDRGGNRIAFRADSQAVRAILDVAADEDPPVIGKDR